VVLPAGNQGSGSGGGVASWLRGALSPASPASNTAGAGGCENESEDGDKKKRVIHVGDVVEVTQRKRQRLLGWGTRS